MDIDQIIAESLLDGYVATLRGTYALLAYWRAWRHILPRTAAIHDAELTSLLQLQASPTFARDPATGCYGWLKGTDMSDEIDAFHRRRAIWAQIESILDQPDDTAIDALYALVNGPHSADVASFFIVPSYIQPPKDPLYAAYMKHFYRPYTRRTLRPQRPTHPSPPRTHYATMQEPHHHEPIPA